MQKVILIFTQAHFATLNLNKLESDSVGSNLVLTRQALDNDAVHHSEWPIPDGADKIVRKYISSIFWIDTIVQCLAISAY